MKAKTFTLEQIEAAISEMNGFCLACGEEAYNVEPDAEKYPCETCDAKQVYGAEQIVLMGLVK